LINGTEFETIVAEPQGVDVLVRLEEVPETAPTDSRGLGDDEGSNRQLNLHPITMGEEQRIRHEHLVVLDEEHVVGIGRRHGWGGGVVVLKNKKFIFFVISPLTRVKIYEELQKKKITNTTPVKNKTHPTPW
jgi:hypothetical protein